MGISKHDVLEKIDSYNPTFRGTGGSDRASIPLGNGEVCANAWVENDGFHFYLARTDAITELDRTVKLGEYLVTFEPNPFRSPHAVEQTLVLRNGILHVSSELESTKFELKFFIDAYEDDAVVEAHSTEKFQMSVRLLSWRTQVNPSSDAVGMFWGDEDPSAVPKISAVCESADVLEQEGQGLLCYHKNDESIVPGVADMHGLTEFLEEIPDVISNRVFGSYVTTAPAPKFEGHFLSVEGTDHVFVRVATFSSQTENLDSLLAKVNLANFQDRSESATRDYWNSYWLKSWIFVQGDEIKIAKVTEEVSNAAKNNQLPTREKFTGSPITRAYLLTKWMTACGARGEFPIAYNGALFTTMPGAGKHLKLDSFGLAFTSEPSSRPSISLNPDERSWTLEQLWQNIRLPYYSLLARGEPEALLPLFRYYRRFWALNKARARVHHNSLGQWSTEMTLSCGLQSPGVYGVDRTNREPSWTVNRWGGAINLSPGLELCKLMFDYWRFTGDNDFLLEEAIPYALDLMDFARSKYWEPNSESLKFEVLNSLETYFDTANPVAVVAGYRRLSMDLLDIPQELLQRRREVLDFQALLPEIPMEKDLFGAKVVAPAEAYQPTRMNVESPELYVLYPFDLRSQLSSDILLATWNKCLEVSGAFRANVIGEKLGTPSFSGWQYLPQAAIMLGLVEECIEALAENSALTNPGFSFPAMWGPIYDAVPDVDHGANILNTLQLLVSELVAYPDLAGKLPRNISIDFKIYSDQGNSVEGHIGTGMVCIYS